MWIPPTSDAERRIGERREIVPRSALGPDRVEMRGPSRG